MSLFHMFTNRPMTYHKNIIYTIPFTTYLLLINIIHREHLIILLKAIDALIIPIKLTSFSVKVVFDTKTIFFFCKVKQLE